MGLNLALGIEGRFKKTNLLYLEREDCLRLTDQRKLESFFLFRKAYFLAIGRSNVGRELNL
jgi:hypothetical protein